jgi:hypothetical protein
MSPVTCRSCADQHPTPVDPSLPSSTPELPATWPTTLVSSSETEEQRKSGTGGSTIRTLYSILKRPWHVGTGWYDQLDVVTTDDCRLTGR